MEHLFWIKKEVDIDLGTQTGQDDVMKKDLMIRCKTQTNLRT
jgi:hypothetical protein